MGLELELDRDGPSLADERALRLERQLALELERGLELERDSVSLDKGHERVDELMLDDRAIRCLSDEALDYIKHTLSEVAYLKTGNSANITELSYNIDRNLVIARGLGYWHALELDKAGFERSPEIPELLENVRAEERNHEKLVENRGYLESMVELAIDERDKKVLMQQITIDQESIGLGGLWNKITGRVPEPYPTLDEMPLTREELSRALYGCKVETESFQQLLDDRFADIQQDPRVAIQNLDTLVNESRERLDNLTLEVKEIANSASLTVDERDIKQPELEERTLGSSRQEELNQNLSQDERELSPTQEIDLSRIDELKELYDNRLDAINQELKSINEAREVEGYWDQPSEIINADMTLANQLTAERSELYQVLEQSPKEQQAYLEAHPELEKTPDSRVVDEELARLDADLAALNDNRQDSNQYATDQDIDELTQSLKEMANEDKSLHQEILKNNVDGVKLAAALTEGAIKEGINLVVEGLQGAGALGVGIGVAAANLDLDKGMTAARGTFETLREQNQDIQMSEFSKGVLDNNEAVQWASDQIQSRMDDSVRAATEMWGEDAGKLVEDGVGTLGKVAALGAMRVPLNQTVKLGANTIDYTHNAARSIFTSKNNIGSELSHMSLYKDQIIASGKLGTPGDIFAGPISNAELSGWELAFKTGLNPKRNFEHITVTSDAFQKVVPIGPFTSWQRSMGHQYTARGILDINTGDFTRTGVNWSQVKNYGLDIVVDSTIAGSIYLKTKE